MIKKASAGENFDKKAQERERKNIEARDEIALMENGELVADELTAIWNSLTVWQKARPQFSVLAGFEESAGQAHFHSLIESLNLDERVKTEGLTFVQKQKIIQEQIDVLNNYKSNIEEYLAEGKKFDDEVRARAEINNGKIKEETEQKSKELGHDEVGIDRAKRAEKRYPNDERIDQAEEDKKKEGYERQMKRADSDFMEYLEKDVVECRKMYAKIEYDDRERLDSARKGLQSKNNEESVSTRDARDIYEKALMRFKDEKIADLKERMTNGIDGKKMSEQEVKNEVRELVQLFGCKEAFDLSQARSSAKSETLMGGDVVKKCWGYLEKTANAYNGMKLWKKVGLSALAIGAGIGLSTGAAATVGVAGLASFVVGAKRVLGGVVAGVGTAKLLDAGHELRVKRAANTDAEKLIKELDKIKGENHVEEGLDKLNALLEAKIANVDAQLKTQKRAALANKFVGISVGVFLGGGYASKAVGGMFGGIGGWVSEHFHHSGDAAKVTGGVTKGILGDAKINTPLTESLINHPNGVPVNFVQDGKMTFQDALHTQAPGEMKTIEKGSNIEKTLVKFYKEHGLKFNDNGHAAHIAYRDYMHDYIENHKDELIKSGKLGEYQKMLKDGMVNIQPGTEIIIDPHTGNIISIDGKLSHLHGHNVIDGHQASGGHSVDHHDTGAVQETGGKQLPDASKTVASITVETANNADVISAQDLKDGAINFEQQHLAELETQHASQAFALQNAEDSAWTSEADKLQHINKAIEGSQKHLKSLLELNDSETFTKIGKDFFDGKGSNVRSFGGKNVIETLKNPDNNLNGLSKKAKNLIIGYASSDATKPKVGENFKVWAYRIMTLSRKD